MHGLRRNILGCVPICFFRGTFRNVLGEDPLYQTLFLNIFIGIQQFLNLWGGIPNKMEGGGGGGGGGEEGGEIQC